MTPPTELPDIRPLRPESYVDREILWARQQKLLAFAANADEDFDWLEHMILRHGYYEQEGIWTSELRDKRVMAEIMAAFTPRRALEIGCASGPILQCLMEMDVDCAGVEISRMALDRASPRVRDRIHHGDLLSFRSGETFDLVFGLDVFEHLNPNKLDAYLARIAAVLPNEGHVFANIPAFDHDPVFGLVFPPYVRDWYQDIFLGRHFRLLHVDARGYPINGHLVWADSRWWVSQFERHGFHREEAIERAIHGTYDHFFDSHGIARKAFYVFSKNGAGAASAAVAERVLSSRSGALEDWYASAASPSDPGETRPLLLASDRVFAKGWHPLEVGPRGPFRWSQQRSYVDLVGLAGFRLRFQMFTNDPSVARIPVTARFVDHRAGVELARASLTSHEPVPVEIAVPRHDFSLEVAVDPTWVPKLIVAHSEDARELGIGVRDARIVQPGARLASLMRTALPTRVWRRLSADRRQQR